MAVSIVGHLDLQTSQTGIPVELTVIPVGLRITATHWPLVGLTALQRHGERIQLKTRGIGIFERLPLFHFVEVMSPGLYRVTLYVIFTSIHRQLGSPFSVTAHSLPAPQNTLAHTLLLLCSSLKKGNKFKVVIIITRHFRNIIDFYRFHTQGGAVAQSH